MQYMAHTSHFGHAKIASCVYYNITVIIHKGYCIAALKLSRWWCVHQTRL